MSDRVRIAVNLPQERRDALEDLGNGDIAAGVGAIIESYFLVECRICGEKFRRLTAHLKTHRTTLEKYRERFPSAPMFSQAQLHQMSKARKRPQDNAPLMNKVAPRDRTVGRRLSMASTVKCKICGAELKNLGPHLRSKHDMTVLQYQHIYPGAEYMVESTVSHRRKPVDETLITLVVRVERQSHEPVRRLGGGVFSEGARIIVDALPDGLFSTEKKKKPTTSELRQQSVVLSLLQRDKIKRAGNGNASIGFRLAVHHYFIGSRS